MLTVSNTYGKIQTVQEVIPTIKKGDHENEDQNHREHKKRFLHERDAHD